MSIKLLTKLQVAERLNVSAYTVGQLIRDGKLTAIAVNGIDCESRHYRVPETALDAFMAANTMPSSQPASVAPRTPRRVPSKPTGKRPTPARDALAKLVQGHE